MSKAHDLPFEICQKIFEHLSDPFSSRDLINCAVTCHSWSEAAKQMLYQKVNLDGSQVSKLRKSLNQHQHQHQQPLIENGKFVIDLGIGYDSDIEDFGDEDSDGDDSEDEDLSSEKSSIIYDFYSDIFFVLCNMTVRHFQNLVGECAQCSHNVL